MPRAAIYARFSSDLQSDRSIEDQEVLCREVCGRAGYSVVATYEDRALSGTSTTQRAGFQAMMKAAALRSFDVIVVEDIDRLFRNEADFHAARQRLSFLGISIHTAQGVVSRIEGSLRAMMSALFIENLALHVHRGMSGVIRDGRHAGGNPYGYRPVKGEPGQIEIVESEAAVIRRIFEQFAAGISARDIAAGLNSEGVKPPRGALWRANTLHGDAVRQFGLLRNPLYVGQLIWNKTHKVRDPDTGRRLSRPNPESKWQRAQAPHLRIVSDELFAAANQARAERSRTPLAMRRAPKRLLSGLLRCGACSGGMSIKDYDDGRPRIQCTTFRESGACQHGRAYPLQPIEADLINGLRDHLGSRAAIAHFIRCYNDERERHASDATRLHSQRQARLASVDREIERTVAAVVRGTITDREADRHLPTLRQERDKLIAELMAAGQPVKVVAMHPAAVSAYLRDIESLDEAVNRDLAAGNPDVAASIRRLVSTVTVMPAPAGTPPRLRIDGHLASLIDRGDDRCRLTGTDRPPAPFAFDVRRSAGGRGGS